MSQTMQQNATTKAAPFAPIDYYERLIKLRAESPDDYLLRTSPATRAALVYYEAARRKTKK
jgi:hypothetical protein